ncbi:MAG: phosphodiester glycosidase family protein [Gemmatimonadales bacterium]
MTPRLCRPLLLSIATALLIGCIPSTTPSSTPPVTAWAGADSAQSDTLAAGLVLHTVRIARGPWTVYLLEADRTACWVPVAVKAGGQAVGRQTTSALIRALADTLPDPVGGGVNADFFSFQPPGIPVGPHINDGQLITGPTVNRPALAFDRDGRSWMGLLGTSGFLRSAGDSIPVAGWNQRRGAGIRFFDDRWGDATDSASRVVEVAIDSSGRVLTVDTAAAGTPIPAGGSVVVVDGEDLSRDAQLARAFRVGDTVTWRVALTPLTPVVAVGGLPILLTDSVVTPKLDSVGGANFGPVRHPRTAVAVRHDRQRLLLITVDGRQPSYSEGMTLAELATFLRDIGATDAINLDGGGSTTMAVPNRDRVVTVVNRPSDRTGERPVANALAVVRRCRP